jgi:hypothetical protein
MPWLTHLPSKYTLACVATRAPGMDSVIMGWEARAARRELVQNRQV